MVMERRAAGVMETVVVYRSLRTVVQYLLFLGAILRKGDAGPPGQPKTTGVYVDISLFYGMAPATVSGDTASAAAITPNG